MAREDFMQRYIIGVPRRKRWRLLLRDWQLYLMLLLPVAFYVQVHAHVWHHYSL